jgi:hypothetical protein
MQVCIEITEHCQPIDMVINRAVVMAKEIANQIFRGVWLHLVLQEVCQVLARSCSFVNPLANIFQ